MKSAEQTSTPMGETREQRLGREMAHRTGSSQDASTQPFTGSALKALVRGWIAGTAGLPGDIEGLARKGINWSFGPGGVNVDPTPVLPTTDFYKEWLPGKQQGDDVISTIGSVFGGVGATKPIALGKGALSRVASAAPGPMAGSRAAMRGVIKAPGGNWLAGSVEDALSGLRRHVPAEEALARAEAITPNAVAELRAAAIPDAALNNFIDKQLTRYIKNDMATERDPIRALAERGVLHVDPSEFYLANRSVHPSGEALQKLGQAPMAKQWENISDNVLRDEPASALMADRMLSTGENPHLRQNPWLAKVPPETRINRIDRGYDVTQDLGFGHLMDELRNATNPASGLPRELLLKPESLSRVSMPQAVEHVAKINAWREAQKVAANQSLANNAATALHKDYPDKGFKWVELRTPSAKSVEELTPDQASWYQEYLQGGVSPEKALTEASKRGDKSLADALKYEGDTMGHCVGGYCDDVAAGKSRIFSLRDAKGQPHVTIETAPSASNKVRDLQAGTPTDYRIVQIKGKANRKPNDEYLPFVQDFVKSGQWSDVGDLHNTGLIPYTRKVQEVPQGFTGRTTLGVPFDEVGIPEGYYTNNELLGHLRDWQKRTGNAPGYADGGTVRNVANAAVGGTGLAKAVGNAQTAVGNIAAGNASVGDLKALHDMASQLGYTSPGLSQALGLAGVAKAGYNLASDPSGMNAAKFAATVNPIAAQALGLYNAATDPNAGTLVNALSNFNPMLRGYNALADSFGFANIGQVLNNLNKIADPNVPAQLRDLFSNNPNSSANAREANALAAKYGIDPMDAMMHVLGVEGAPVPGQTVKDAINAYNQAQALQNNDSLNPASPNFIGPVFSGGDGEGASSSPSGSWGGSFPSYSGGDATDSRASSSPAGGIGIG